MKKALITGITGQDGFFLSKFLLTQGYEVHGLVRRNSTNSLGNLELLEKDDKDSIIFHCGDIIDANYVTNIIRTNQFDEIYHLAAQSFVGLSFKNPAATYTINIDGTLHIVNAVKDYSPQSKVYFAATSELYGKTKDFPQNEETPFYPRSPYGVSKLAGFWTIKNYRESYDLYMASGILFNHESEVRGPEFITRKISLAVAKISKGKQKCLEIGNMEAKRDWGYAKEYVKGMWMILQQETPDDYVLSSGKMHSVRDFVVSAFKAVNIDIIWEGEGVDEIGKNAASGETLVKINPEFFRPAEVEALLGDSSKAEKKLGWKSETTFEELVEIMVKFDLKLVENEKEIITLS